MASSSFRSWLAASPGGEKAVGEVAVRVVNRVDLCLGEAGEGNEVVLGHPGLLEQLVDRRQAADR